MLRTLHGELKLVMAIAGRGAAQSARQVYVAAGGNTAPTHRGAAVSHHIMAQALTLLTMSFVLLSALFAMNVSESCFVLGI